MTTPEYQYLVGYLHKEGMGRATVQRSRPIISIEDIEELDAQLTKSVGFECSTFTFNLLGAK